MKHDLVSGALALGLSAVPLAGQWLNYPAPASPGSRTASRISPPRRRRPLMANGSIGHMDLNHYRGRQPAQTVGGQTVGSKGVQGA